MYVRDDIAVNQLQKIISYSTPSIETGLCYLTTPEDDIDLMKSTLIDGKLNVIISSIPFEEPLSGLKHIVFCHPVPTRDRFISCCAPAVESSEPVSVHLIFNNSDIDSMTKHINAQYPDRRTLANVYKKIKWLYDYKKNPVHVDDVLSELGTIESKEIVFSNSIAIFEEIKIVEQQKNNGKITLAISADADKRHDLKESMLYSEGDKIRKDWVEFSDFLLKKSPADFIKMLIESY